MIRNLQVLLCALGILLGPPVHAGLVEDLASPVTTDAKWILISGSALTLATTMAHRSVFSAWEDEMVERKPLGHSSRHGDALGQWIPNLAYAGGAWASQYWGKSPLGYDRALMMLEASAYAGLVTVALKVTIREPRPGTSTARNSFPSGHTATAFAFAGVVAAEHGWYYGVPAMLLATFVGFSRINDNQHRVHDVVGGATVGLTCAYGIYYAHQEKRKKPTAVQLIPVAIPGGTELAALWSF